MKKCDERSKLRCNKMSQITEAQNIGHRGALTLVRNEKTLDKIQMFY